MPTVFNERLKKRDVTMGRSPSVADAGRMERRPMAWKVTLALLIVFAVEFYIWSPAA